MYRVRVGWRPVGFCGCHSALMYDLLLSDLTSALMHDLLLSDLTSALMHDLLLSDLTSALMHDLLPARCNAAAHPQRRRGWWP